MDLLGQAPSHLDVRTPLAVFRYRLERDESFGAHDHPLHQLSWSTTGTLTAEIGGVHWAVSPGMALWIPADVPHDVGAVGAAELYIVKFNPPRCPVAWTSPTVVVATDLLRSIARHLADPCLDAARRQRLEAVLFDELIPVSSDRLTVPLPRDPRALAVARGLIARPADARTLSAWGAEVGASERTLVRLFAEQTSFTFTTWHAQVRVRAALAYLEAGDPPGVVAARVGYRNVSAFIDAFQRLVGVTPGAYHRHRSAVAVPG